MYLNLDTLTKKYTHYQNYFISLELDLLRFKNNHDLMGVDMKITEESSFNTIKVSCKSHDLLQKFNLCEKEFKKVFKLKLIKSSQSKIWYDDKTINVYNYVYTNVNNNHFDELIIK